MLTVKIIAPSNDTSIFEARQVRTDSGNVIIETDEGLLTYSPPPESTGPAVSTVIYVMNGSGSTVGTFSI